MNNTLLPSELMVDLTDLSMESNTVKTEIIEKIPMVIPNSDKKVLVLFTTIACMANK
jgi:hypothetical protein